MLTKEQILMILDFTIIKDNLRRLNKNLYDFSEKFTATKIQDLRDYNCPAVYIVLKCCEDEHTLLNILNLSAAVLIEVKNPGFQDELTKMGLNIKQDEQSKTSFTVKDLEQAANDALEIIERLFRDTKCMHATFEKIWDPISIEYLLRSCIGFKEIVKGKYLLAKSLEACNLPKQHYSPQQDQISASEGNVKITTNSSSSTTSGNSSTTRNTNNTNFFMKFRRDG